MFSRFFGFGSVLRVVSIETGTLVCATFNVNLAYCLCLMVALQVCCLVRPQVDHLLPHEVGAVLEPGGQWVHVVSYPFMILAVLSVPPLVMFVFLPLETGWESVWL